MANRDFVVKNGLVVNTSALVVSGSNTGIGTTTPDALLKVSGTANVSGNAKFTGQKLDVSANTIFTGNVEVQNTMYVDTRLYVGNTDTMVTLTNPIVQAVDNFNGFVMISSQNLSQEDDACADLLIYADNTNGLTYFNDLGLNNSRFDGTIHRVSANTQADNFVLGETVYQANSSANIAVGIVRDITTFPGNTTARSVKISVANGAAFVNTSGGNLALKGVTSGANASIIVAVPFGTSSTFSRRNYPFTIGVRGDGYLYNANSALTIGTTDGGIRLFTNTVPSVSFSSGSNTITTSSTTSLYPDLLFTGTNVPAGAWITAVTNSTSFKISALTTGTSSGTYTVTDPYYEAAGNPIVFHTNGMLAENEIARFSGNGNFTIGSNTAARGTKLHVQGTSNVTGAAQFGSTVAVNNNISVGNATVRSDISASGNVSVNSGVFATSVNVGTMSINSTGHISGNINFDSNTLFIDAANNKVGIGTNNPDVALTVVGSANVTQNMRVAGDLLVSGNLSYVGTSIANGDLIPGGNGYLLGNSSRVWTLSGNSATFSSSVTVSGNTALNANVTIAGNSHTIAGNLAISNAVTMTGGIIVIGNSTVNTQVTNSQFAVANSTSSLTLTPGSLVSGNSVINTTAQAVGANVIMTTSGLLVGNSSVNAVVNSSAVTVGTTISNSSGVYAATVNAASHTVGSSTIANSSGVYASVVNAASHTVGTSTIANSSGVYATTVNAASHTVGTSTIANSSGVYTGVVNGSSHTIGSTLIANTTGIYHTGTINAASLTTNAVTINTTAIALSSSAGLVANGSTGTAGQALHTNGTTTYWADDEQGVTSVSSGNGLSGGPITTTGTLSVVGNNGIQANSSGVFAIAGTGTWVNSSGIHVNTIFISTLSVNSASYLGSKQEAGLNVNNALNANNSAYLGGTIASSYQTTAGLSANVATLTANAAGYLNGKTEDNLNVNNAIYLNGKQESDLNVNNATTVGGISPSLFLQNTYSGTLSGNLTFTGTNGIYGTTSLKLGANVLLTTDQLVIGNSTVNTVVNSSSVTLTGSAFGNNATGNRYVSSATPTGGNNGDIWLVV